MYADTSLIADIDLPRGYRFPVELSQGSDLAAKQAKLSTVWVLFRDPLVSGTHPWVPDLATPPDGFAGIEQR